LRLGVIRGSRHGVCIWFVIGRAGPEKTFRCIEAIRRRLVDGAIEGPRLLLLVPEQASLQMERALVQPGGTLDSGALPEDRALFAAHRAEVLSFRRLAYRIMESAAAPVRPALSETARAMVLRHLFLQHRRRLRYYGCAQHVGGLFGRLGDAIAELMEESVSPASLSAVLEGINDGHPAQTAKLHDVHLLYLAYLDYLAVGYVDPSKQLEQARSLLPRCAWLTDAELWVDGFASLSGEESRMLVALSRMCSRVEVTAMFDASLADVPPGDAWRNPVLSLFARTHRTYWELRRMFRDAGVAADDPELLSPSPPPRFLLKPGLTCLEETIFRESAQPVSSPAEQPCEVEVVALPTRRWEVEYAVARVCEWVEDTAGKRRYRDVAIIVRDLQPYHDLLAAALESRGIPFFLDQRRSVSHHPVVELLRVLLQVAAEDLSLESARLLLKTGLLPLASSSADALENYLLAHGLAGLAAWRFEWTRPLQRSIPEGTEAPSDADRAYLIRLNQYRKTVLGILEPWLTFAASAQAKTGIAWADALRRLLAQLDIAGSLQRWVSNAESQGDLNQAEEHRQVWHEALSFLDHLAAAFATAPLSITELAEVVESGLSGLSMGLAPPMMDQVLVGSIDRSRHPDLKAVVILGFNDGIFPRKITEDAILNDDDRRVLSDAGIEIRPPARDRVLDERLLLYTALTRPSEALVITYAAADEEGKSLRPSPYLEAVQAACPGMMVTRLGDPVAGRDMWPILTGRDLGRRLATEFRSRPPLAKDDPAIRGRWNRLYEAARTDLGQEEAWRSTMQSLAKPAQSRLSAETVRLLFSGRLKTSVSQLETFATCPFQYFARYALRLQERAEAALAPVDVGRVHHAVLEDFVAGLAGRHDGLRGLTNAELTERLQESCSRVGARLPGDESLSGARDAYVLRRSAEQLGRVLRAQRAVAERGTAKPRAVEVPFGFDSKGSLPELSLTTPAGRSFSVRGYIDRVDLAELGDELLGVVIDYKRTRDKRLPLTSVYHGLSLQLLAYLLVLAEHGQTLAGRRIRPAGGLYVSLLPRYELMDHPSQWGEGKRQIAAAFRPRGIIEAEAFSVLDKTEPGSWSRAYSFFRSQVPGSTGHVDQSDAASRSEFNALLGYTRQMLGQLADGILDGDVAVRPYRLAGFSPCTWCALGSVCRFEMGLSDVRFLESLKRSEAFARLTQAADRSGSEAP